MKKQHIVSLDDGTSVSYWIRGLKENEIESWAAFCASVFSYKSNPPPPSYFARHYYNDPTRNAELIRVACYQDNNNETEEGEEQIVASCRVFVRNISLGPASSGAVKAGGIGEVCTLQNHRRRGLSKALLKDAIRIMTEEQQKMEVSLLHAAPTFFPVYQSSGYQCTKSKWSTVKMVTSDAVVDSKTTTTNFVIRMAQFPHDTNQLQKLHQQFTEQNFLGSIVRSKEYWNSYLSKELEGSLYVLCSGNGNGNGNGGDSNVQSGNIIAWLSIRPRGDRYQVREFGCDRRAILATAKNNTDDDGQGGSSSSSSSYAMQFQALLGEATKEFTQNSFTLLLPTFMLDDMRQDRKQQATYIDWETETEEDDLGWMYRSFCPVESALKEEENGGMPKLNETIPHLIWPSDSF